MGRVSGLPGGLLNDQAGIVIRNFANARLFEHRTNDSFLRLVLPLGGGGGSPPKIGCYLFWGLP